MNSNSSKMIERILVALMSFNCLSCVRSIEINLDKQWQVRNSNGSIQLINQTIPSGIYSTLESANVTGSVLYSYNDVNLRWIAKDNWTYSLLFDAPANNDRLATVLVFHGIDSNAQIYLNDVELGKTSNMFTRYRYNLKDRLLPVNNTLRVEITSPIHVAEQLSNDNEITPPNCPPARYHGECHVNFLRKMQASFSWDWGLAAPSMGLWKNVQLEVYQSAVIRDVTYNLEEKDLWVVHVTTYFESDFESAVEGSLTVEMKEFSFSSHVSVSVVPDENGECNYNLSFQLPKDKVELWWPNGYGDQRLYTLKVTWEGATGSTLTNNINSVDRKFLTSSKSIRIGFRTIELIEEPLDGGLSFYFKINKLPIFMKGSNWIPLHILPEKGANSEQLEFYFKSMKFAHMNMIRVWGGGVYESDNFYDLADEYGILIWQDMMFACAMYPVFDAFLGSVKEEIKQNIRRLQSHPSIAVWAGNNENEAALRESWYGTFKDYDRFAREYLKLYKDTIAEEVKKNDEWHLWLYSSPSNGKKRSNESIIQNDPQDWHYGDIHFYNYVADGWNANTYPRPRFVSEYGFQSIPSLSSWKSVLRSTDSLSELIDHRQHFPLGSVPILELIHKNLPELNENNTNYLETLIYFSQISQAMTVKTETEVYRIEQNGLMNTMGSLFWQLNDVWVAPSWSSIEYNGNYKILHHFARKFFAPIALAVVVDLTNQINVHIIRDIKSTNEDFQLTMRVYSWSSLKIRYEHTWNYTSKINRSVEDIVKFHLDTYLTPPLTKYNAIMEFSLSKASEADNIISTSFVFPSKIKDAVGIKDPNIKVQNIRNESCQDPGYRITTFDVSIEAPAIFVYIEIHHDAIDRYELSDNGFMQFQRNQTVGVKFYDPNGVISLGEENVHILTVNKFMI
ncbi:Beta-mannosidase [Pseudolycoriella hygida]|uniref:beta-mannosidase n=1 Tax=Pseudolycoriella hygida TaxID=35572 RepID=A0A9Q0S0P8_9DIPT|nr:Beta-mannosidase [Pseudolycoriella hygida]